MPAFVESKVLLTSSIDTTLSQTGSGKTYTMSGMEDMVARDIFQLIDGMPVRTPEPEPEPSFQPEPYTLLNTDPNPSPFILNSSPFALTLHPTLKPEVRVSMQYFELAGKKVFDLLGAEGAELKLMEDSKQSVLVVGSEPALVNDSRHLVQMLRQGQARRATYATEINPGSSRSHAVCRVMIEGSQGAGLLTLVDCAGSERKEDSNHHDVQRQKEGAEINASLHALKECIRYKALQGSKGPGDAKVRIPYRASNLTKVLADTFIKADTQSVVICCLSPTPTDTEHIISTLNTGCKICGLEQFISETKLPGIEDGVAISFCRCLYVFYEWVC
jgi:hypothetical protein